MHLSDVVSGVGRYVRGPEISGIKSVRYCRYLRYRVDIKADDNWYDLGIYLSPRIYI